MYSQIAVRAACRVGHARVPTSLVFNVAKKLSQAALSKQVATLPMLWRSPAASSAWM